MGVLTFMCRNVDRVWTAKQYHGDLEASDESVHGLQRKLVKGVLKYSSEVKSNFSMINSSSAVFEIVFVGKKNIEHARGKENCPLTCTEMINKNNTVIEHGSCVVMLGKSKSSGSAGALCSRSAPASTRTPASMATPAPASMVHSRALVPDRGLEHGTSITVFRQNHGFEFGGDSRGTSPNGDISINEYKKICQVGKNIMWGRAGQTGQTDKVRKKLKNYISNLEKNPCSVTISVEEAAKKTYEFLLETGERRRAGFQVVIGGFDEGSDVPSRLWVVNQYGYWQLQGDYACIGSGRYYCSIIASTFDPSMDDAKTRDILYKSIFAGAKCDIGTGGRASSITFKKEDTSGKALKRRSRTIKNLMQKFDDEFNEEKDDWSGIESISLWQADAKSVWKPRLIQSASLHVSDYESLVKALKVRPITMIGLRLSDAIILLRDGAFGSKIPRAPEEQVSQIVPSLALVGYGKREIFAEIEKVTIDLLIKHNSENLKKESSFYAGKIVEFLVEKKMSRRQHPYYLLGGYDQLKPNIPPTLFLWLITKAGYFNVESSIVVGSEFSDFIIGRKFNQELSINDAERVGLEALANDKASCTTIKLPTSLKRQHEDIGSKLFEQQICKFLPAYSRQQESKRERKNARTLKHR